MSTSITKYVWAVWKNCRLVGYVQAYSELQALSMANKTYGRHLFIERSTYSVSGNPTDLAGVAVVSENTGSN